MPRHKSLFVISGTASAERNPEKAREIWNVHAKGWWPDGSDSPNLVMIRVRVEDVEY
jgi:general stress protein 26